MDSIRLTEEQLTQFASRLSNRLLSISSMAEQAETILYRSPHHTGEALDYYIPANIIQQYSSIAEEVIKVLSSEMPSRPAFAGENWDIIGDQQKAKKLQLERN